MDGLFKSDSEAGWLIVGRISGEPWHKALSRAFDLVNPDYYSKDIGQLCTKVTNYQMTDTSVKIWYITCYKGFEEER